MAASTFTQLLGSDTLIVQCCFAFTETVRTLVLGTGSLGRPTSTFTELLSSDTLIVQCCFTFTEYSVALYPP